uniref:Uncharacterized protein n=1 Tax=Glycine max TaxID=3847 RepID=K7KIU8_SOYBN
MEKLKSFREKVKGKQQFLAMYSSIFGGITTDPAAMVIPIDDHMVHSPQGPWMNIPTPKPNAILKYDIARYPIWYMTRKLFSPNKLRITIRISIHGQNKPPYDRGTTRRILIQTDQEISTYLPLAAIQSCLYAIAIRDPSPINFMGVKVVTSNVPIKPQFATTKSVNYLPNVGAFVAIWFDSDGFVAEGPSMNVAFVSKENEFVMPLRDNILSGCTAKRVLTLAESLVKEGKLCGIRMKNVNVEEGKKCR